MDKVSELDFVKRFIEQGYLIAMPQQGVNQCPDGLLYSAGLDVESGCTYYFVQIYNPDNEGGKVSPLIFTKQETYECVDNWRRSQIDYSAYKLNLIIRFFVSAKSKSHDLPLSNVIGVTNFVNSSNGLLPCDFLLIDGKQDCFEVVFETVSKNSCRDENVAEVEEFELNLDRLLAAYSIVSGIGYVCQQRHLWEPETTGQSGEWFSQPSEIDGRVIHYFEKLSRSPDALDASSVLSLINRQMSLRAKIIIGYSYIEGVFYESQEMTGVFKLNGNEKGKLARCLLKSAKNWLQENDLQDGNEIKKDFFNRKMSNRETVRVSSIGNLLGDEGRVLEMIPKLNKARNTLAHDVNCNSDELNECLSFLQEVIIAYIDRKLGEN